MPLLLVVAITAGDTNKTPTVCDPDNSGTDKADVLKRMSHKTSSTAPTPGVCGCVDSKGYPGNNVEACEKPGSLVNVFGSVGTCPLAASEAIKTRSFLGSGYMTAGV